MAISVVSIRNVSKFFSMGAEVVRALQEVSVEIDSGDFVAITGASGSGKSTLMNLIGLLDKPTHGACVINGLDSATLDDDAISKLRNLSIGFIFQSFNLLPRYSALRNVELPLVYASTYRKDLTPESIRKLALESLRRVGLEDRKNHAPNELSGGQRQRVAIARALVNSPKLLLADEPTGNLDSKTGEDIFQLFEELNSQGVTIVIVTHDPALAKRCRKIIKIVDGRIVP